MGYEKMGKVYMGVENIGIHGIHAFIFRDAKTGKVKRLSVYRNTITTVGKTMLSKRIVGEGNDCNITYGAVGTGVFPANPGSSTTLVTEDTRKTITSANYSGAVATILTYFGSSDANGTLTEWGQFGEDATAAADSGTLFNHTEISEEKTSSETLSIESQITFA